MAQLCTMTERNLNTEVAYLYRRAEQELEQAQGCDHPAAVRAHYVLASHYLDRLYGPPAAGQGKISSDRDA